MSILGTICARGGSKGVKNKNIRLLLGKPLISYSINALKSWAKTNRIVCSTDSDKILEIAKEYGAETPFVRPAEMATDTASKLDVLKHLLNFCEAEENIKYDYIVDLDPTAPLRSVEDIDLCYNKIINNDADLIVSVYKADKNPYFNMLELDENNYAHLVKDSKDAIVARQKAPIVYSMNASIYVYKRDYLMNNSKVLSGKVLIHEMPEFTIDVDKPLDFEIIKLILKKGLFKFDY